MRHSYEYKFRVVNSFGVPLSVFGRLRGRDEKEARNKAEKLAFNKCATHNLPTPELISLHRVGLIETVFGCWS